MMAYLEQFSNLLKQGRGTRNNPKPKKKKYLPPEKYSVSIKIEKPNPMLENVRMEYIEKIIQTIPPREKLTVATLQQYLKSFADQTQLSQVERAYLAYYWVAHNIDYDLKSFTKGKELNMSSDNVLKTGQSVCGGFSTLYHDLVTAMGINCVNIDCFAKGYGFQIGEAIPNKTNHQHNAIELNGAWFLVDSTWGAGSVVDKSFKKDFNNYYFCCEPKEFILTHFPTDPQWQLLHQQIPKEVYSVFPFIDKRFFQFGFKSMSPFISECTTEQILDVEFYYDPDLDNNLRMNANLYLGKKEEKNSVLIQKYDDFFRIRILLNKKGTYVAHFFGINGEEERFRQITEIKINCNKNQDKPLALPKMENNYGELALEAPFCDRLPKGSNINFKLYSFTIDEITIVRGNEWIKVPRGADGYFQKTVEAKGKEVKICENRGGKAFPKFTFAVK